MGTAEVESALVSHPAVAEAAVVGFPHEIKGQGIYAYVTLKVGQEYTEQLKKELVMHVRKEIGPIASPDVSSTGRPALPKTRSGKIMRRILRKMAAGESDFGDTSTLADPQRGGHPGGDEGQVRRTQPPRRGRGPRRGRFFVRTLRQSRPAPRAGLPPWL